MAWAVYDSDLNSFNPKPTRSDSHPQGPSTPSGLPPSASAYGDELGIHETTFEAILQATRQSVSWKACESEGSSWEGTADDNVKKYLAITGGGGEEVRHLSLSKHHSSDYWKDDEPASDG